jgi:hypothetical protein
VIVSVHDDECKYENIHTNKTRAGAADKTDDIDKQSERERAREKHLEARRTEGRKGDGRKLQKAAGTCAYPFVKKL